MTDANWTPDGRPRPFPPGVTPARVDLRVLRGGDPKPALDELVVKSWDGYLDAIVSRPAAELSSTVTTRPSLTRRVLAFVRRVVRS